MKRELSPRELTVLASSGGMFLNSPTIHPRRKVALLRSSGRLVISKKVAGKLNDSALRHSRILGLRFWKRGCLLAENGRETVKVSPQSDPTVENGGREETVAFQLREALRCQSN